MEQTGCSRRLGFPMGACLIVAALCVAYQTFFVRLPEPSDLYLALPLAKAVAHPGLYGLEDLVISSGLKGPFHLYKSASVLYRAGVDVDVAWHWLYLAFLFAFFATSWAVAFEITGSAILASVASALLAVVHPHRGSLNWAWVPLPALVTAHIALPLGLASLWMLIRERYLTSLIIASFAFNVHPYIGFISFTSAAFITLGRTTVPVARRIWWVILAGLIALPNAVYIFMNVPAAVNVSNEMHDFYKQFRVHAYHAFVEDHWLEGYGWFFLNLAGAFAFLQMVVPEGRRQNIRRIMLFFLALMGIYVLNAYALKNKTILLMFLFRATYFLKPIIFALVCYGVLCIASALRARKDPLRTAAYAAAILLALSSVFPNVEAAEAQALIAYALLLLSLSGGKGREFVVLPVLLVFLGFFQMGMFLMTEVLSLFDLPRWWFGLFVGLNVAASFPILVSLLKVGMPSPAEPVRRPSRKLMALSTVAALGVFIFKVASVSLLFSLYLKMPVVPKPMSLVTIKENIRFSNPQAHVAHLFKWAREATPKGSLFLVPPLDTDFLPFRLIAERGVFVTIHDINQLAFDPSTYGAAQRRLERAGVRVLGRHKFADAGYHALTLQQLRSLRAEAGIDYAIFYKGKAASPILQLPSAYSDGLFIVIDLSKLSAGT